MTKIQSAAAIMGAKGGSVCGPSKKRSPEQLANAHKARWKHLNLRDAVYRRISVVAPEQCWFWNGAKNKGGYGKLSFKQRHFSAHRAVWEIEHGPIPPGIMVCHGCDVRHCCNPSHLFLGTAKDNIMDCASKGRLDVRKGVRNPAAKLSEKDVLQIRELHRSGVSHKKIAARFHIGWRHSVRLCMKQRWGHI